MGIRRFLNILSYHDITKTPDGIHPNRWRAMVVHWQRNLDYYNELIKKLAQ